MTCQVYNFKRLSLLKALQAQSRVWPKIICRAPKTSPLHQPHDAHSATSTRYDGHRVTQRRTHHSKGNKTARKGWEWQTYNFISFPSLEIAIRADLIKSVCIIELCREILTGSRYSFLLCAPEALGFHDRDFCGGCKPDVNRLCVLKLHAYRKQSCIYESSAHPLETVMHLSLSRSATVCLSTNLAHEARVLHFLFGHCISKWVREAFSAQILLSSLL